ERLVAVDGDQDVLVADVLDAERGVDAAHQAGRVGFAVRPAGAGPELPLAADPTGGDLGEVDRLDRAEVVGQAGGVDVGGGAVLEDRRPPGDAVADRQRRERAQRQPRQVEGGQVGADQVYVQRSGAA